MNGIESEKYKKFIEKDLNARTGTKGGRLKTLIWEKEAKTERESKDEKINRKGK